MEEENKCMSVSVSVSARWMDLEGSVWLRAEAQLRIFCLIDLTSGKTRVFFLPSFKLLFPNVPFVFLAGVSEPTGQTVAFTETFCAKAKRNILQPIIIILRRRELQSKSKPKRSIIIPR